MALKIPIVMRKLFRVIQQSGQNLKTTDISAFHISVIPGVAYTGAANIPLADTKRPTELSPMEVIPRIASV